MTPERLAFVNVALWMFAVGPKSTCCTSTQFAGSVGEPIIPTALRWVIVAPERSWPVKFAPERLAEVKFVPAKEAFRRFAPERLAEVKFVPASETVDKLSELRSWPLKLAPGPTR